MSDPNGRHPAGSKAGLAGPPRAVAAAPSLRTVLSDDEALLMGEAILRLWRIELDQFALFDGATDPDEAFAAADPYFLAGNKLAARVLAAASHSREGTWARLVADAHGDGHSRQIVQDMELQPLSAPVRAMMDEALGGKGLVWQPSWPPKPKPGCDAG
jgi:hypothetical protein